jgi:hypothetical protein
MSAYRAERDITPAFVDLVTDWIGAGGEVLVVVRWVAGWTDFALCRSRADFEQIVELIGDGSEVLVFRDQQLPVRGRVDEALIARALKMVPDNVLHVAVTTARKAGSPFCAGVCENNTHADLEEALRDWWGVDVAFGYPNWWVADHEGMISRAKGGVEGPR